MAVKKKGGFELPRAFRKLKLVERRRAVEALLTDTENDFLLTGESDELVQLADVLVESAVGYFGVPLGVAEGFLIDGEVCHIPLATEEPSVIAAATYAAKIIAAGGGFKTESNDPVMAGTVYFDDRSGLFEKLNAYRDEIGRLIDTQTIRMKKRGGGFKSIEILRVEGFIKIRFNVDVRDAMGANLINTVAELVGTWLSSKIGYEPVISILTNSSCDRIARASFSIESKLVPSNDRINSDTICKNIVRATDIAKSDPERGVTHNKGIMNGISALALATGNDTRGIEAAAHAWAGRSGRYAPLSEYSYDAGVLTGRIELPLPIAATGGAVSFHRASRVSLALLGNPGSTGLSRIAVATGLAQNFAALLALVSGGIQKGHMRLHARRIAYAAGARGAQVEKVAGELHKSGCVDVETAHTIIKRFEEQADAQS